MKYMNRNRGKEGRNYESCEKHVRDIDYASRSPSRNDSDRLFWCDIILAQSTDR